MLQAEIVRRGYERHSAVGIRPTISLVQAAKGIGP